MSTAYQLLDSGNFQKLEQVGAYRIVRPALNAFWEPALPSSEWNKAQAVFTRDSGGNGSWSRSFPLPESWTAEWGGFRMKVKPTGFGHLGFFAEQYRNWELFRRIGAGADALNLFAYSGLASLAMAAGGARVCHLDAAQGMIEWGRVNLGLNPDISPTIRWIADDVNKFTLREVRRGSKYSLIALDPPSFGRGPSGQVWKIETDLPRLLEVCRQLRDRDREFTIVLSCHSPGFSLLGLERLLRGIFGGGEFDSAEMTIPESTGRVLPSGLSVTCRLRPGQGR